MSEEFFEKIGIKTDEIKNIFRTIKLIQKRMKDNDLTHLEYIHVYDKLSYEFDNFFNTYPSIFVAIIKGSDLSTYVSTLYYRDKVLTGEMRESDIADMLATKYFPPELKKESDNILKSK